jgi:hypothetical protein
MRLRVWHRTSALQPTWVVASLTTFSSVLLLNELHAIITAHSPLLPALNPSCCLQTPSPGAPTSSTATSTASSSKKSAKKAAKSAKKQPPKVQQQLSPAELRTAASALDRLQVRALEWAGTVLHFATHYSTLRATLLDNWLLLDWMEVRVHVL